jgi:hypothetical protein
MVLAQHRQIVDGIGGSPNEERLERVETASHPGARQLVQFWHSRQALGGVVIGRDVPSREVVGLLNNIVLFEPISEGNELVDLRTRLAGDALRLRFGRDISKACMSELFDESQFAARFALAKEALEENTPIVVAVRIQAGTLVDRRREFVLLPVWNRDKTARWLLVGVFQFG